MWHSFSAILYGQIGKEDAVEFPGIFEYQHQLCDWISAKKRGLNVS
jgi:hypothetical protein